MASDRSHHLLRPLALPQRDRRTTDATRRAPSGTLRHLAAAIRGAWFALDNPPHSATGSTPSLEAETYCIERYQR